MIKQLVALSAAAALLCAAGAASAEQWVDYKPAKGVWSVSQVRVEPNRIDDYMLALKKTWVPSQEMGKRHGLLDQYFVQVKTNPSSAGPNVILGIHYMSMAKLDPNQALEQAMDKEYRAIMPKAQESTAMAERAQYRTVVGEDLWQEIDFGK